MTHAQAIKALEQWQKTDRGRRSMEMAYGPLNIYDGSKWTSGWTVALYSSRRKPSLPPVHYHGKTLGDATAAALCSWKAGK